MTNIDHSSVFAPFFNSQRYLHVKNVGVTKNFYVATTGSDSNNGEAVGTPFLTIQKAIDVAGSSIHGGEVIINIADGTYNENLLAKDIIGSKGDIVRGNSVVTLLGNTALPSNVIIIGDSTTLATFKQINSSTIYILDGLDLRSDSGVNSRAIYVDHSILYVRALNISLVSTGFLIDNSSRVKIEDVATGGTWAVLVAGISSSRGSTVIISKNLTLTGFNSFGFAISGSSNVFYSPPSGSTSTFTADPVTKAFVAFQVSQFSVFNCTLVGAAIMNITDITRVGLGFVLRIINNGTMFFNGSGTAAINITNAIRTATIEENSFYTEGTASIWTHVGYSPTYLIDPGSAQVSVNEFSGAVAVGFAVTPVSKYGSDFRYIDPIRGFHSGVFPLATTAYFTANQIQSDYFPLYIAQEDEIVDKLQMSSRVGNGVAHTDTYTVVKNGVDTTMVLAITDAASGSTTTNPVTLAAGDTIGIKVATDAATVAADIDALLSVRKI